MQRARKLPFPPHGKLQPLYLIWLPCEPRAPESPCMALQLEVGQIRVPLPCNGSTICRPSAHAARSP